VPAGAAEVAAENDGVTRPLTAVIVGGGPGGIAACVALRRVGIDAHGRDCWTVLATA
jgi:cation diffusion facilitator CzcD-associated flavoprotein CzcO